MEFCSGVVALRWVMVLDRLFGWLSVSFSEEGSVLRLGLAGILGRLFLLERWREGMVDGERGTVKPAAGRGSEAIKVRQTRGRGLGSAERNGVRANR